MCRLLIKSFLCRSLDTCSEIRTAMNYLCDANRARVGAKVRPPNDILIELVPKMSNKPLSHQSLLLRQIRKSNGHFCYLPIRAETLQLATVLPNKTMEAKRC